MLAVAAVKEAILNSQTGLQSEERKEEEFFQQQTTKCATNG